MAVAEFRQDRLCVQDLLIDNTGYSGSFLDANRVLIFNYFYDNGLIPNLLGLIHTYRKIGKDPECHIHELLTYNAIIELFVLMVENVECFDETIFNDVVEEYKLECIREHLKCSYGTGHVIDDLIDLLRIRFGGDGIDYMTVDGPLCQPFKIE